MSVLNLTIVRIINGDFEPLNMEIKRDDHRDQRKMDEMLIRRNVYVSLDDPSTPRMIPECFSDGSFVFLSSIASGMHIPINSDIELCYFDDSGTPEHVNRYYNGIMAFDTHDYKTILMGAYPNIISININL